MVTTNSWAVNADGDWSVASNWSLGTVPDSNNNAVLNTASLHTVTHSTGDDTVNSLKAVNDRFTLSGGTLTVLTTTSLAKGFTQTGGVLSAGTVTVALGATLTGGAATGNTLFNIAGTTAIGNYTIGGSATLQNAHTVNETGAVTLGDNTGANATITNLAGATYRIQGDYGINAGATSAVLTNAGTFGKSAGNGTSVIGANMTNTGTISAATGTLEFTGANNVVAGVLTGAGAIAFGSGLTTLTLGTTTLGALDIFGNAQVELTGTASLLNGAFNDLSSGTTTFDIGSGTLTVAGPSSFEGAFGSAYVTGTGSLMLGGETTAANAVFGGRLTVVNAGTFAQTGAVTIGDTSGNAATLTNSGTYELTTDDALVHGTSTASAFVNSGTFEKTGGGGTNAVALAFTNAAGGVINAGTGAIAFDDSLVNAGLITGAGTVELTGTGTAQLNAGSTLSVSEFAMFDSSSVSLGRALQYSGSFLDQSNGATTLALGAYTLSLIGTGNVFSGSPLVTGTGTLVFGGPSQTTLAEMILGGTETLRNSGKVNQTGTVAIGDSSGNVANVVNTGSWTMANGTTLQNGASTASQFTNSAQFVVTAGTGTATLNTTFVNSGTITISTGVLQSLGIMTNSGLIKGTELAIGAGSANFNAGTGVTVQQLDLYSTATLNLGANLAYAGFFNDSSGGTDTINLNGHNLTLNGGANFIGTFGSALVTSGGTLFTKGTSTVANMQIGANTTLDNTGTINASGQLTVGDNSANAAQFVNAGTYDLTTDTGIGHGSTLLSSVTNNGLFEKTAGTGTSIVSAQFTNSGTLTVTSGTIEFSGGFANSGVINGTLTSDGSGNYFVHA